MRRKGDREQSATDDRDACFIGGFHFLGIQAFTGVALGMIEPKICAYLQPQMRKWLIRLGLEEPEEEHKDKIKKEESV